jgi:hypothetical protein
MAVKIVSGTQLSDSYIVGFLLNKMPLLLFSDRIRFYFLAIVNSNMCLHILAISILYL